MRPPHRLALAAALLCLPAASLAQYENGSIVGTVHDASGAVIPDATVTVTNSATGVVSTRTSNGSGDFEVPALRVGSYTVTIAHPGFTDARATDVTVSVSTRQRVDLTLAVGDAGTTVEVSGINLQIEADTSQRGQIITNYQTAALPLVSRNYSDLIGLTTGARPTAGSLSSFRSPHRPVRPEGPVLTPRAVVPTKAQRSEATRFTLHCAHSSACHSERSGRTPAFCL